MSGAHALAHRRIHVNTGLRTCWAAPPPGGNGGVVAGRACEPWPPPLCAGRGGASDGGKGGGEPGTPSSSFPSAPAQTHVRQANIRQPHRRPHRATPTRDTWSHMQHPHPALYCHYPHLHLHGCKRVRMCTSRFLRMRACRHAHAHQLVLLVR